MNTPWSTLASAITNLHDRIEHVPTIREATVASLSPVSVLYDTDTVAVNVQGSLTGVSVGDRVLTTNLKHYIWILGVKAGAPAGWIDLIGKPGYIAKSGWTVDQLKGKVLAYNQREIRFVITYTGSNIVPTSDGNISDRDMVGIPPDFRPVEVFPFTAQRNGHTAFTGRISTDGGLQMVGSVPGATITTGSQYMGQYVYSID